MNLTRTFARSLSDFATAAPGCAAAARLFLDGIAVASLGAGQAGPRLLGQLARNEGADDAGASVIGQGIRAPAVSAARINGAAMHVLDFEPMWNPANHALSTTLPGLLALAETETHAARTAGPRLLDALVAGIEAQARLRLASGQFEPKDLTFHPPGIFWSGSAPPR